MNLAAMRSLNMPSDEIAAKPAMQSHSDKIAEYMPSDLIAARQAIKSLKRCRLKKKYPGQLRLEL